MWIVELALRRPHTFIVLAIAICLFGLISLKRMAIDIFPVINLPVVSCVWTYTGMSPYNIENLVTTVTERALTSTVNGIQRMESMSLNGMSIIKVYLQQGTPVGESVAMVASVGSAILRQLPRNISAPFVTASSATDVPVLQLGLISDKLSEAELFDIANSLVRTQLATVQGTITPFPYGGKYRQIMIDLIPNALIAYQLSANDIVQTLQDQNVSAPSGTVKMGSTEYVVTLNNLPATINEINNFPVKTVKDRVVFIRDIAQVYDGYQPQLNIVNLNGKRAVLFNVLKAGDASTLDVVSRVKAMLPRLRSLIPASCKIEVLIDQSKFVRECVDEVTREALIAAGLTALMMLALLGSWRSTVIVATSIPLAMLSAIIGLGILGHTINSMTLGGLALAVGMLVDDATVVIENVHVNLAMGKDIVRAILDGAEQVALPALVSTMSICIVFVPVLFLGQMGGSGPGAQSLAVTGSLFMPMGLTVVLAMMASYGLSRTVVPLMMKSLLKGEGHEEPAPHKKGNIFSDIYKVIDSTFERTRENYQSVLATMLAHRRASVGMFTALYVISSGLLFFIGQEYFPTIDSGQLRVHVTAPAGTRIEQTERIFHSIEDKIRQVIPAAELEMISDNIGMPVNGLNYAYSDSQTISEADGEILVSLKDKRSHSTAQYEQLIRQMLRTKVPEVSFFYQPADIVTQILNAGLPAPIDIKVIGLQRQKNFELAEKLRKEVARIPGATDVVVHQVVNAPNVHFDINRILAGQMGITQNDVSNSFFVTFSSSFQTNPSFWLNPKNGINYNLTVQTPQYRDQVMNDIQTMSVTPESMPQISQQGPLPSMLLELGKFQRKETPAVVNHFDVQPVFDIYATTYGRDLGSVSRDVRKIVKEHQDKINAELKSQKSHKGKLLAPTFIFVGGQVMSMMFAYMALVGGLAFALVLVYLLLVVNFQSWSDPLIILMAIPGALSGILWGLFLTQTNFSIPALMGAIMTIGVASANSILMVTFAREELRTGKDALAAALNAGHQRFRPVIMTATAMIIGMIPMAIGAGSGGSQNAPIGRVVIGGLIVATFCTLFFVPIMFSIFRQSKPSAAVRN